MRLIISFVIASLFCFVLMVPAEAQQPIQSPTPAGEKVAVSSAQPCISDERKKERERIKEYLIDVARKFMANPTSSFPSIEYEKGFTLRFRIAEQACDIRRRVEKELAAPDRNFKIEQLQKVLSVAIKLAEDFNARGAEMYYKADDLLLMQAFVSAYLATGVIKAAASPELTKPIKPEQIQHAMEISNAVLRQFNESGKVDGDDSDRVIEVFLTVCLASETIQKAGSPKLTKGLTQEKIQDAIKRSERIVAEFKTNEWNSKFADDDAEALKSFQEALKPPVEQKQVTVTKKSPTPTKAKRKQRRRAP